MKTALAFEAIEDGEVAQIAEATVVVDLTKAVAKMNVKEKQKLVALLGNSLNGEDFIAAFEDADAPERKRCGKFTDRGILILDSFVEHAADLDRLPEDYEFDAMVAFEVSASRLHKAIWEGDRQLASDILRECGVKELLSDAAAQMVGSFPNVQPRLL